MKCLAATVCISKKRPRASRGGQEVAVSRLDTMCEKRHGFMAPIGRPRWLCLGVSSVPTVMAM